MTKSRQITFSDQGYDRLLRLQESLDISASILIEVSTVFLEEVLLNEDLGNLTTFTKKTKEGNPLVTERMFVSERIREFVKRNKLTPS